LQTCTSARREVEEAVPAALELQGVAHRFGRLGPLDLRVDEGQTLVVLGPSGAGKTTLLRLLLGLLAPDQGTVRFRGEDIRGVDAAALRRRIGYVVQGGGLFPHLTAEGNIALVARWLGWREERIAQRVRELLDLARLPQAALLQYPAQLSGGQAQRVGLLRALMLDPEVLLLDEPLGALDPVTRYDLQGDLKTAFERLRKTVVLVTHDLGEAAFFAHRIVLLHDGRIAQEGTFEELAHSPADEYVARFVHAQRAPLERLR
jgi:osmoprotectant transport system ATP-binding protein